MLKNRSYMGEHVEGGDVFECPKFIEPEVYEGVQKMWAEAKLMHNGRPPRRHLLSGYLRCPKCGRRYRTVPNGGYPAYVSGSVDRQRKPLCDCQRILCKKAD